MKDFNEYINMRGYSWNDFDRTYEMEHLIEQYADEKVKLALDTSSVVERSEQLICPNCDNHYPHTLNDGTYHCDDCDFSWSD